MAAPPTMRDVAARAGVSTSTISRVLNEDPYVKDETRQRVEAAMAATGYTPNLVARSLRTGRQMPIGVAVPQIADPFFAEVTQAVEIHARQRGTAVLITSVGDDPTSERNHLETMLSRQIAGLIAAPVGHDLAYLRPWQRKVPMVFIDRAPKGVMSDCVLTNDFEGAYAATTYLVGLGHQRIAYFGDPPRMPTARRRQNGYRAALVAASVTGDAHLVCTSETMSEDPLPRLAEVLNAPRGPTAIFSSNSRCTINIVKALKSLRRSEIPLVSFGDFPLAAALTPSVPVVDQDPAGMGRVAAERLFLRIDEPSRRMARQIIVPSTLVVPPT